MLIIYKFNNKIILIAIYIKIEKKMTTEREREREKAERMSMNILSLYKLCTHMYCTILNITKQN